jgi:hypothetical protein
MAKKTSGPKAPAKDYSVRGGGARRAFTRAGVFD